MYKYIIIIYYITNATQGPSDILSMTKMLKCKSLMCGKHRYVKFALNIFKETNPKRVIKTSYYKSLSNNYN